MDVFDKLFEERGGRFNTDNEMYSAELRTSLVQVLESIGIFFTDALLEIDNKPNIEIGFTKSFQVGAGIRKYQDTYYIGLNVGSYVQIFKTLSVLLTNNHFLFGYGEKFNDEEYPLIEEIYSIKVDAIYDFPYLAEIFPEDVIRRELLYELSKYAIINMALHELGHIVFGHYDFVNSVDEHKELMWEELEDDNKDISMVDVDNIQFYQLIESEADIFSILVIVNKLHDNYSCLPTFGKFTGENPFEIQKLKEIGYDEEGVKGFTNFRDNVYLWRSAVYSSFKIFGTKTLNVDSLIYKKHLPAGMRNGMLNDFLSNYFAELPHTRAIYGKNYFGSVQNTSDPSSEINTAFDLAAYGKDQAYGGLKRNQELWFTYKFRGYTIMLDSQTDDMNNKLEEYRLVNPMTYFRFH